MLEKTTLLNHILNNREKLKVAVIVNDMSEVNIDANLVENGGGNLSHTEEKLVEMSNGCICCTLREDLLTQVRELASEKKFDYLLIESTGISEPLPVATTFDFRDENGNSLSDVAKLDTMVTVVDSANLIKNYSSTDFLNDRGESLGEDDQRTIVDLLVEQIEFANVILLNKIDLISNEELKTVEAIIRGLNTKAKIIKTELSRVELENILGSGLFNIEEAQEHPLWAQELYNFKDHKPETDEYGISSFVIMLREPFDPKKIYDFFNQEWPGVLRSKGFFWISSRPDLLEKFLKLELLFVIKELVVGGLLFQISTKEITFQKSIKKYWNKEYGDRRQEIVFIGLKSEMDVKTIKEKLDNCLIKNYLSKPNFFQEFADPFPLWFQKVA